MHQHPNTNASKIDRRVAIARGTAGFAIASANLIGGHSEAKGADIRPRSGTLGTRAQAIQDYQTSLAKFGGRLASSSDKLLQRAQQGSGYDVVIIGSGYGASICAARLAQKARPGCKIALLERGKEWMPGTFPDRFLDLRKESQHSLLGLDKRSVKNPTGLLNVQQDEDVTVLSSCGLGGTSLINANVAIRPDNEVFQQPSWPNELSDRSFLDPYFDRAEWELGVLREPIDLTAKMRAQRLAAERLADQGAYFESSALTITRGPQTGMPILNRQGMIQRACTNCGDCMTGCNVGAKNTLAMNYLPLARQCGVEMFTEIEVDRIEKCGDFYRVHFIHHRFNGVSWDSVRSSIHSRLVILGAGSLGSTEILLRSQSPSLQLSPRLGCSWSGNGDILGYIRRTEFCTKIGGLGAQDCVKEWIGPTIQSNVTYPHRPNLYHRVIVQEGASASAYNLFNILFGRDPGLDHTQIVLVSGHDGAQGRIELASDGRAVVRWPGLQLHPYRQFAAAEIHRFAAALGGEYQELAAFHGRVGTVHPLGGCGIASSPMEGVINSKGQVFDARLGGELDPRTGTPQTHTGLYVVDAAAVPTALGVNPFLTISALAERFAEYITLEPDFANLFSL